MQHGVQHIALFQQHGQRLVCIHGGLPPAFAGGVPFDSLSALCCAIYLEWRQDVVEFDFEPRKFDFAEQGDRPAVSCIPDFEATLDTGKLAIFEAKYAAKWLISIGIGYQDSVDPTTTTSRPRLRVHVAFGQLTRQASSSAVLFVRSLSRSTRQDETSRVS